jgi:hypothetical protein
MCALFNAHCFEVRDKVCGVEKVGSECPVGDRVFAGVEVKSWLRNAEVSLGFGGYV